MNNNLVEINKIKINETEQFNGKLVEKLAASIELIGLLNPIVLTPEFELVAGRHRLEAYKTIGHTTIPATIVTLDEMHQRMATIDENLLRKRLTRLEYAMQLRERKAIYELLYPETRRGVAGAVAKHNGGATDILSFAADVAEKTGQTVRNVTRQIGIGENLAPEVRELIKGTAVADSFSEMSKLGSLDYDRQVSFAELIHAGKAKNFAEANRLENHTYSFAKTDKGDFHKSLRLAERALRRLIDGGEVQKLVDGITEEHYVHYKDEVLVNLKYLQNLQERVQVAIEIYQTGIRNLEANTFVVHVEGRELALAE